MSVRDLISAAYNKDAAGFESTLHAVMQEKMAAAIQSRFSPAVYEEEVDLEEAKAKKEDDDDEDEMCEDVDQIDEVSGAKLGAYIVKARKSEAEARKKDDDSFDAPENDNKEYRKPIRKVIRKREYGQSLANDKLRGSSWAKVHAGEK